MFRLPTESLRLRPRRAEGRLRLSPREQRWLGTFQDQADALPDTGDELLAEILASPDAATFLPAEYGLG